MTERDMGLCKRFGITSEKVESDVERYERGDFSDFDFAAVIDGQPASKMRSTSLKLPEFELAAIDRAAKAAGISRSAFIRRACSNEILALVG